jgi:D-galactarolactone cycloisomerase
MRITAIRLDRMRLPLDPPFRAAWDPVPRRHFDATLVRVQVCSGAQRLLIIGAVCGIGMAVR